MIKTAICLLAAMFALSCGSQPPAKPSGPPEDPKITAIKSAIAKTTPEQKAAIDKAKAIKPEVNGVTATKTLGEIADNFAKNNAQYNINPIGWEASQKKNGRWKIVFHYQDYQKQLLEAEWEMDPVANKVYPFEFKNAKEFFTSEGADTGKGKKGK
jgi:hypothetical protein